MITWAILLKILVATLTGYTMIGNVVGTYLLWLMWYTSMPFEFEDITRAVYAWPKEVKEVYRLHRMLMGKR